MLVSMVELQDSTTVFLSLATSPKSLLDLVKADELQKIIFTVGHYGSIVSKKRLLK